MSHRTWKVHSANCGRERHGGYGAVFIGERTEIEKGGECSALGSHKKPSPPPPKVAGMRERERERTLTRD